MNPPQYDLSGISPETMLYAIADLEDKGRQSYLYSHLHELLGMPVVNLEIARKMRAEIQVLVDRNLVRKRYSCSYPNGHRPVGRMTYTLTDEGKKLFSEIFEPIPHEESREATDS